jgi:hypothetical protein
MLVVKGFSTPHTTLLASPQVERGDNNPSLIFNPHKKSPHSVKRKERDRIEMICFSLSSLLSQATKHPK